MPAARAGHRSPGRSRALRSRSRLRRRPRPSPRPRRSSRAAVWPSPPRPTITLTDSSRGREIPVHVTYPEGAGPFPVIVFSHGAGARARPCRALARFWATHGFVVLAPTHADSLAVKGKDPTLEAVRETAATRRRIRRRWENRARDLAFVIAATAAVEARVPALKGKLDDARVGVGGHSYGAFTAELLAGATVDLPKRHEGARASPTRPRRPSCSFSPPGKGQQGLTEKSWAAVDRPLMVVTGIARQGREGPGSVVAARPLPALAARRQVRGLHRGRQPPLADGSGRRARAPTLPRGKGKAPSTAEEEVAIFKDVKIASARVLGGVPEGRRRTRRRFSASRRARDRERRQGAATAALTPASRPRSTGGRSRARPFRPGRPR